MTREAMDGLTLDQIEPGMRAKRSHTVSHQDLRLYSSASGDLNPLHLPELDGDGDGETEAICPAAYLAGLVSGLIGTELPGPGSRETAWSIRLGEPVRMGETVTIELEAEEKDESVALLLLLEDEISTAQEAGRIRLTPATQGCVELWRAQRAGGAAR